MHKDVCIADKMGTLRVPIKRVEREREREKLLYKYKVRVNQEKIESTWKW